MIDHFLLFLGLILIIGAVLRQDFIFTIVYLVAGAYIVGSWWSRKSLAALSSRRSFTPRAFLNEEVRVRLDIENKGWLPVVWLRVYDSLPVELSIHKVYKQVLSLGPYEKASSDYFLSARKRGYYQIGPLLCASSDLLGLSGDLNLKAPADFLTVYPKIVPLNQFKLPSSSPLGTLRHKQPIYEDPTRILGKRDYVTGDSLRRVDWKATATTGRLQVRQFEPSIALETVIYLNLNSAEYDARSRFDATELAVIIAASVANWVASEKQPVGMVTNGLDPLGVEPDTNPLLAKNLPSMQPVPPRKGRSHLMRILDQLARVQAGNTAQFVELLRREYYNHSWGTTLVLITALVDDELFDTLFQVRRAGMNLVLVLVGAVSRSQEIRKKGETFNIPIHFIRNEQDLDIWRR